MKKQYKPSNEIIGIIGNHKNGGFDGPIDVILQKNKDIFVETANGDNIYIGEVVCGENIFELTKLEKLKGELAIKNFGVYKDLEKSIINVLKKYKENYKVDIVY